METCVWAALVAGRVLPSIWMMPPWGGSILPPPVKAAFAILVTIVVFPMVEPAGSAPTGLWLVALLIRELFIGTALALVGSLFFEVARMGGEWMDQLRGGAGGETHIDPSGGRSGLMGTVSWMISVIVFFAVGGAETTLQAFQKSFERFPLGMFPSGAEGNNAIHAVLHLFAEAFKTGTSIAFPAILALLIVDVVLGLVQRTAPQLPVYFIGMPLRALMGFLLAALLMEHLPRHILAFLP
jgi:flagellar biosynthesis protein FliR